MKHLISMHVLWLNKNTREKKKGGILNIAHLLGVIDIEKIRIEDSLNDTGKNRDRVEKAFKIVPVNPVGNIECSIKT